MIWKVASDQLAFMISFYTYTDANLHIQINLKGCFSSYWLQRTLSGFCSSLCNVSLEIFYCVKSFYILPKNDVEMIFFLINLVDILKWRNLMSFSTRCGETIDRFFQSIAIVKEIFPVWKLKKLLLVDSWFFGIFFGVAAWKRFYGDQTAQESLSFNRFYDRWFEILIRVTLTKRKTNWKIPWNRIPL